VRIQRGVVYLAGLDPRLGTEPGKVRTPMLTPEPGGQRLADATCAL
jgi:mRNA-degrading endonuclease toxin of MazEF toxin-antitoxin module